MKCNRLQAISFGFLTNFLLFWMFHVKQCKSEARRRSKPAPRSRRRLAHAFRFPKVLFAKSTFGAAWARVSLRLGHARVLPPHSGGIHCARAASLPTTFASPYGVFLFCQAFSFAPLAPKEKADVDACLLHGYGKTTQKQPKKHPKTSKTRYFYVFDSIFVCFT